MSLQPKRPQTIGQVVDLSLELFKPLFRRTWWLCLPVAIVGAAPTVYTLLKAPSHTIQGLSIAQDGYYWALTALIYVVNLWTYGTVTGIAAMIGRGDEVSVGAAIKRGARMWPLQLVIMIAFSLILVVGFLLFIVPGMLFSVSLMLSFLILIVEGGNPFAAMARSHRLIWGNWWRSFAILSIGTLVWSVAYAALGMTVGASVALGGAKDLAFTILMSTTFIAVALNILTVPFITALMLAIYWDVKLRKEGDDLSERIDALAAPAG